MSGSGDAKSDAARRILLAAPPGHFDVVLAELRNLLGASASGAVLNEEFVAQVRHEHDSSFHRDVLTQKEEAKDDDDELIAALRSSLEKYVKNTYANDDGSSCGVRVVRSEDKEGIEIVTHAERLKQRSGHVGSWSGQYTLRSGERGGTKQLTGRVQCYGHTFEGGNCNVHLRAVVGDLGPATLASGSAAQVLAKVVMAQIQKWETASTPGDSVNGYLDGLYDNTVNDAMKKCLRRVMPITRTKMDWNLQPHLMVQTLSRTAGGVGPGGFVPPLPPVPQFPKKK